MSYMNREHAASFIGLAATVGAVAAYTFDRAANTNLVLANPVTETAPTKPNTNESAETQELIEGKVIVHNNEFMPKIFFTDSETGKEAIVILPYKATIEVDGNLLTDNSQIATLPPEIVVPRESTISILPALDFEIDPTHPATIDGETRIGQISENTDYGFIIDTPTPNLGPIQLPLIPAADVAVYRVENGQIMPVENMIDFFFQNQDDINIGMCGYGVYGIGPTGEVSHVPYATIANAIFIGVQNREDIPFVCSGRGNTEEPQTVIIPSHVEINTPVAGNKIFMPTVLKNSGGNQQLPPPLLPPN
jgi:hypothetical protein